MIASHFSAPQPQPPSLCPSDYSAMYPRPVLGKQLPRADVFNIIKTAARGAFASVDGYVAGAIVLPDALTSPVTAEIPIEEGRELITAMKSRWNEWLPIHLLPLEILIEILLYVDRREKTKKRNITLARVCKHWKNVVSESSPFWTQVQFEDGAAWVRETMARGPAAGIRVICDPLHEDKVDQPFGGWRHWPLGLDNDDMHWASHNREASTDSKNSEFFDITASAVVKSFKFHGSLRRKYIYKMSAKRELKELQIFSDNHAIQDDPPIRFATYCRIHHLVICIAPIEWNKSVFSALRSLRLHNLRNPPPTSSLLVILQSCPSLEWIVLQSVGDPIRRLGTEMARIDDIHEELPLVWLPRLRSLVIMQVAPRLQRLFLHSIVAPELRYICAEHLGPDDFYSESFLQLLQGPLRAAAEARDVIDVAFEDFPSRLGIGFKHRQGGGWSPLTGTWKATRPGVDIFVQLREMFTWPALEQFLSNQNGNLASVSFDGATTSVHDTPNPPLRWFFANPDPLSFLRQWSSVSHLALKFNCETQILFHFLASPYYSDDGQLALPLPHLTEVGLFGQEDFETISTLIGVRGIWELSAPITRVRCYASLSTTIRQFSAFSEVEVVEMTEHVGRWASFPFSIAENSRYL